MAGHKKLTEYPEVLELAQKYNATPAQVLIAWGVKRGYSVIPKSVTPSRIRENFQEVELDEEAIKALDKLGETPQRFNIPTTCE